MANAYYDETAFNDAVSSRASYDNTVKLTLPLPGHTDFAAYFTGAMSPTTAPYLTSPKAFMLTPDGAWAMSSPSLQRVRKAADPGRESSTARYAYADAGSLTYATSYVKSSSGQYSSSGEQQALRFMTSLPTDRGALVCAIGSQTVNNVRKSVFVYGGQGYATKVVQNTQYGGSGSGSDAVTVPSSDLRLMSMALNTPAPAAGEELVLVKDSFTYDVVRITSAVDTYFANAHDLGYACVFSAESDVDGVFHAYMGAGSVGVATPLTAGTTQMLVNGGGYKPFVFDQLSFPFVEHVRVRPLVNPALLDGVSRLRVQVGFLSAIAGSTTSKGAAPDELYDNARSSVRYYLDTFADPWGDTVTASRQLDFVMEAPFHGDYSSVQDGFELPTAKADSMTTYGAVRVNVTESVSDPTLVKGLYVAVDYDPLWKTAVFVVEISVDGVNWAPLWALDVASFEAAKASEGSTDGFTNATRKHLVDVVAADAPSPAAIFVRMGRW